MNKRDFQRAIVEAAREINLTTISDVVKVSVGTVEKWYKGLSAPVETGRELAIEAIHNELQARKEERLFNARIKKYLQDNLKIVTKVERGYYSGDGTTVHIKVVLENETLTEDWASVYTDSCSCDCYR